MSQECICKTIKTKRIGEILVPRLKERKVVVYRFALDCPVHGIRYLPGDPFYGTQDKPETVVDLAEENRKNRKLRRQKKFGGPNARHSDVPKHHLPGAPELPEEPAERNGTD